jgi:hypothetical protein
MKRNHTMKKPNATRILLGVFALATTVCSAGELYVAPDGKDSHPGTAAKPLATLQAGVNRLAPGDTLLVRGGIYRETVTFPLSGAADRPITVKAVAGETVVVSGCDPVAGWTRHQGRIWKAPMNWTLGLGRNQVFAGDQVLIEARHPNTPAPGLEMYVSDLSPLWPSFGRFSIPQETRVAQPGRITSPLLDGQADDYWKGALYYGVHYEGWAAQTGVIESSKSGEISVGDRTQGWWFGSAYGGHYPPRVRGRPRDDRRPSACAGSARRVVLAGQRAVPYSPQRTRARRHPGQTPPVGV